MSTMPEAIDPGSPERPVTLRRVQRLADLVVRDTLQDDADVSVVRTAEGFDFSTVPEPEGSPHFDARIPTERIGYDSLEHNMLYGAMYAGVRLADARAHSWARLGKEFTPDKSHFFITGDFARLHEQANDQTRRLSLRVIPDTWENPAHQPPFSVRSIGGEKLALLHHPSKNDANILGIFDNLLPPDSPSTVSYYRGNRREGDNGIVLNPIMTCPHRCQFCSRQYDTLNQGVDKADRAPLMVLSPKEMVDHLAAKYGDEVDWENVDRVSLVTGSFDDFDHMETYIGELRDALYTASDGKFNTYDGSEQEILVLTHLAREPDQFRRLKAMGVALQDTIEMLDDAGRERVMPVATTKATPKHHFTQDQIMSSVPHAVEILGPDKYRATIILGLDDIQTTFRGLERLKAAGVRRLYYPAFQPYGTKDKELYRMTFTDILESRQYATEQFARVY